MQYRGPGRVDHAAIESARNWMRGQMYGQHVVWTEPGLPAGDAIRPVTDAAGPPPPTVAVTVRVCVVTLDLGRLQPGEGTGQHTVPVV